MKPDFGAPPALALGTKEEGLHAPFDPYRRGYGVGCGELWKGDDGIVQLEEGELMLVGSLVSFRFVSSDGILGCDNG